MCVYGFFNVWVCLCVDFIICDRVCVCVCVGFVIFVCVCVL